MIKSEGPIHRVLEKILFLVIGNWSSEVFTNSGNYFIAGSRLYFGNAGCRVERDIRVV